MEQFNHEKKQWNNQFGQIYGFVQNRMVVKKKIINIYGAIDILVISQYHFRV